MTTTANTAGYPGTNQSAIDSSVNKSATQELNLTREMFNLSGQHSSFDNVKSEDGASSNDNETPAKQLSLMKKHVSPKSFIKISQTDLIEMEQEIAQLKSNLSQHAEENKGLILMQDCHIRQITELKQLCQAKDDKINEMQLQTNDYKMMADEVMTAREKSREAETEKEVKVSELA